MGQSIAATVPILGDYRSVIETPSQAEVERHIRWEDDIRLNGKIELNKLSPSKQKTILRGHDLFAEQLRELTPSYGDFEARVRGGEILVDPFTWDDKIWAAVATLLTASLLYRGRYKTVQNLSTALVVVFTFITLGNVVSLQNTDQWHISARALASGLSF